MGRRDEGRLVSADDDRDRLAAAQHAVQTLIALEMGIDPSFVQPKHMRVGVDTALVEIGALGELLVDKGVITLEEYIAAMAHGMEREVQLRRERLGIPNGVIIQ